MSAQITFDKVAAAYDGFMGRWTRLYVPALLRAARLEPGQRVLDLATGTGESALMAADALGPRGRLVGADLSLPMLRGALAKVGARPIRLAAMDGQALACRAEAFDAVICQLGLMFFPDPLAGLREARRVLRPGGGFAAVVWSTADRVPWGGALAWALLERFPDRRDEILRGTSLGEPGRLERLLGEAGFRDVGVTTETRSFVFDSFDAYWDQVASGGIRFGLMLRELAEDARRAVRDAVRARLERFASRGGLEMPTDALVASGKK
ncbi:MAG TPA: methyltransferase domain-containing protein [Methylomirabilota bacterium]|nr:methyltransferase domain-containing protein [Methylomirabilota bacterium]